MPIEQDIKQDKFRNEFHKGTVNLIYTYGWLMERQKKILDSENVTPQQFNILRILRGSSPRPLSTMQIRERLLDKMSDTSRIVDRLVAKQLVSKKTCTYDKRLVDVSITEKGIELLARLDTRNEEMDELLKELSEDEIKQLNRLLDKVRS